MNTDKKIYFISEEGNVEEGRFVMYTDDNHTECCVRDQWGTYSDVSVEEVFESIEKAQDYLEAMNNHEGRGEYE